MKRIIAITLLAALIVACNKDKFQTKPQIKIKSVTPNIVPVNGTLSVILQFTDKEGDVSDSIIVVRERTNQKSPITPAIINTPIPSFPNTSEGEIQVFMPYQTSQTALIAGIPSIPIPGTGNPPQKEPDTLSLKFVVRDKAGNKSDTALTSVIVIRQ
jgi:hypothetical protein